MTLVQIKSCRNGNKPLFEGHFHSMAACLEQAVAEQVNLEKADLRNINLTNANLDGANLAGAHFTGANLSGANLSEANLKGARFEGASLYNTCLCYSDLHACNFESASFGATDMTGCDLSGSRFSTLSCFGLDFALVENMQGCVFRDPGGTICEMSRPPVAIKGPGVNPVVFMDRHVKIGSHIGSYTEFLDGFFPEAGKQHK
jgi:hypothetical protein